MNEVFSYRNLNAYQQAKQLVVLIYALLKQFPKEEQYSLCDQLRRAVISITSNIAEGMGRFSLKEQTHFIEIAFASLNEVMCQIEISHELNYINDTQLFDVENRVKIIAQLLSGLRKKRIDSL